MYMDRTWLQLMCCAHPVFQTDRQYQSRILRQLVGQMLDKAMGIPSGKGHIWFNSYFLHVLHVFQVLVSVFEL